ncbi:MAG: hypothetical protein NVSMB6_12560 [Burkholderiaceae bacterium]
MEAPVVLVQRVARILPKVYRAVGWLVASWLNGSEHATTKVRKGIRGLYGADAGHGICVAPDFNLEATGTALRRDQGSVVDERSVDRPSLKIANGASARDRMR